MVSIMHTVGDWCFVVATMVTKVVEKVNYLVLGYFDNFGYFEVSNYHNVMQNVTYEEYTLFCVTIIDLQ